MERGANFGFGPNENETLRNKEGGGSVTLAAIEMLAQNRIGITIINPSFNPLPIISDGNHVQAPNSIPTEGFFSSDMRQMSGRSHGDTSKQIISGGRNASGSGQIMREKKQEKER